MSGGRGRSVRTLELVEAARTILQEIQPATVRAVCYRLFVAGHIDSMDRKETRSVSRILVDAREREEIPWEWIVDETREAEYQGTWADPMSFAGAALRSFRRDRWQYQPVRVEVWSEKGTVRGTLAPVLREYGVTLRVFHGFSSATAIMEFCNEVRGETIHALYVGDYDPSGLFMSEEDLPERLRRYGANLRSSKARSRKPGVVLERIALTRDDCGDLPDFDADDKKGDPRYRWYIDQGYTHAWELDAMSPPDLRARVENAILEHIDLAAWERTGLAEAAEQASLKEVLGTWESILGQDQKCSGRGARKGARR